MFRKCRNFCLLLWQTLMCNCLRSYNSPQIHLWVIFPNRKNCLTQYWFIILSITNTLKNNSCVTTVSKCYYISRIGNWKYTQKNKRDWLTSPILRTQSCGVLNENIHKEPLEIEVMSGGMATNAEWRDYVDQKCRMYAEKIYYLSGSRCRRTLFNTALSWATF